MLKYLFIAAFYTFLLCSVISAKRNKINGHETAQTHDLKGKIKLCTSFQYDTFKPGNDIDSDWMYKHVYLYNEDGKEKAFYMYNSAHQRDGRIYTYDSTGRLLLIKDLSGRVEDSSSFSKIREDTVENSFFFSKLSRKLIYNRKKRLSDTGYNYGMGGGEGFVSKTVFNRDKNGKTKEKLNYKPSGELNFRETYEYDTHCNKTCYIRYDDKGSIVFRADYTYDNYDNMVKEVDSLLNPSGGFGVYDTNDKGKVHARYYRFSNFDKYQNWLQEDALLNNKPVKTIKRKIEYYN